MRKMQIDIIKAREFRKMSTQYDPDDIDEAVERQDPLRNEPSQAEMDAVMTRLDPEWMMVKNQNDLLKSIEDLLVEIEKKDEIV